MASCDLRYAQFGLEPEQWAWSSFRHYADGEPGMVLVNETQKAFRPASKKTLSATLNFADSAVGKTRTVSLTGRGE